MYKMNLDNKVLVDKDDLREAIQYVREVSKERSDWSLLELAETLESALAQDNTGYALAPVEPTEAMIKAAKDACGFTDFEEKLSFLEKSGFMHVQMAKWTGDIEYRAMIAAAQKGE